MQQIYPKKNVRLQLKSSLILLCFIFNGYYSPFLIVYEKEQLIDET